MRARVCVCVECELSQCIKQDFPLTYPARTRVGLACEHVSQPQYSTACVPAVLLQILNFLDFVLLMVCRIVILYFLNY